MLPSRGAKWPECINVAAIHAYIGADVFHVEQAFSYHPATKQAQFLSAKDRDYKAQPGLVYGTADLVIERASGLEVWDHKTGADVGDPKANWQMRTLGMLAARAYCTSQVLVGVFYIDKVGDVFADERSGIIGADVIEETEAVIAASLASDEIVPSVDACRWCPGKTNCIEAMTKEARR
jgi:hypothetical protein